MYLTHDQIEALTGKQRPVAPVRAPCPAEDASSTDEASSEGEASR